MAPAVVMLSKRPQAGESKTRLHSHLAAEQAALLQTAFLQDLAAMLAAQPVCAPYIAYSPATPDAGQYFAGLLPGGEVFPQAGQDLGARMLAAIQHLSDRGHAPVLVIGSDLPTLQPAVLAAAVARLAVRDLVLGPSTDGGYWLIGLNRPQGELFSDMVWSTPGVMAETLRRARAARLRASLLPTDTDVDTWPDVLHLYDRLRNPPPDWTCRPARTAACLERLVGAEGRAVS